MILRLFVILTAYLVLSGRTYATEPAYDPSPNRYASQTDYDMDGLPRTWELNFWGHTQTTGADDNDGDGISSLLEYYLGLNPLQPESLKDVVELRHMQSTPVNGDPNYLRLEYLRRSSPGYLTSTVQQSTDLKEWSDVTVPETIVVDDGTMQKVRMDIPVASSPQRFLRIKVTHDPAFRRFYVSPTGSDSADGSLGAPWRTINYAMQQNLLPGDTVIVKPGTYTEHVTLSRSGAYGSEIVLRSEVPGEVKIRPPANTYSTVDVRANYILIDGFDIVGGGGHAIDGEGVHHTKYFNNTCHDSGGSGIGISRSEFSIIDGNLAYNNASTNYYQTSGISIYESRNLSGDTTTTGFRDIIRNNISHDNLTGAVINWDHTDGNGIIIDDYQHTQNPGFPNYTYPTLVENNLCYRNGGKGIQVTWSDSVTVRNNTVWHNNTDLLNSGTWRGELSNAQSSNNTWINNIAVTDPSLHPDNTAGGNYSYGDYVNANSVWKNNLFFSGTPGQASFNNDGNNHVPTVADGNRIGVNPLFINASSRNFRLADDSPAIDGGTHQYGLPATDLEANRRVVNLVDIGVYESGSAQNGIVNESLVAQDDTGFSTPVGTAITIPVSALLANDSDPDGDVLTLLSVENSLKGLVSFNAQDDVFFQPFAFSTGDAGFQYTVSDGRGGLASATVTVAITGTVDTVSFWGPTSLPDTASDNDSSAVELGLRFQVQVDGQIEAIRFYKGSLNTGTHVARIWNSLGGELASVTFTNETSQGWQQANLATPLQVLAGQTYVVSYHAPNGHYAFSQNYFTSATDIGPLVAPVNAGVYKYGPAGSFPDTSFGASNYWIDVVFR